MKEQYFVNISATEKRPIEKSGDNLILGEIVPRFNKKARTQSTVLGLLEQEDRDVKPTPSALIDPALQDFGDSTAILRGDFYALVAHIEPRKEPEGYWSAVAQYLLNTSKWGNWFKGDTFADLEYPTSYVDVALYYLGNSADLDMPSLFNKHVTKLFQLIREGLRVISVCESDNGVAVSLNFADYNNPVRTFSAWLASMARGARGIPLPLLLILLDYYDLTTKGDVLRVLQQQVSVEDVRGLLNEHLG